MTDYSFALTVAIVLAVLTEGVRRLSPEMPSPVLFHNFAWVAAFGIYSLGWVEYVDVDASAWCLLLGGIAAFNAGALLPISLGPTRRAPSLQPGSWKVPGATVVLPLLFLVGVVLYLSAVTSQFGPNALLVDPSNVRSLQGSEEFITAFPLYARLLYFLGPLVFVLYANPALSGVRVPRLARGLVMGATLVALAMSLGRTLVFVALAWQAAVVYLRQQGSSAARRSHQRIAAFLVVVVALVGFQAVAMVTQKDASADDRIQSTVSGPLTNSSWTSLVTYATGGLPAFSNLVVGSVDAPRSSGLATMGPLGKVLPGVEPPPEIPEFTPVPFPHNAYTWFEPFYLDFRAGGVLVLAFLFGWAMGHLTSAAYRNPRSMLIVALMLGLSLWAPFGNKYTSTFTWEYVIILLALPRTNRRLPLETVSESLEAVAR